MRAASRAFGRDRDGRQGSTGTSTGSPSPTGWAGEWTRSPPSRTRTPFSQASSRRARRESSSWAGSPISGHRPGSGRKSSRAPMGSRRRPSCPGRLSRNCSGGSRTASSTDRRKRSRHEGSRLSSGSAGVDERRPPSSPRASQWTGGSGHTTRPWPRRPPRRPLRGSGCSRGPVPDRSRCSTSPTRS